MIASFDMFFLSIDHALECGFLTFISKLLTVLGEKGIIFFLIAVICMLFPKTRKFGVCLFGAVCCGALITNIILKDLIARERPFIANSTYHDWWMSVGASFEDGYSFPSGHVTAAAAGCTAICLMKGKKWIVPSAIWVFLMMFARTYLMAHYPTDVLAGLVVGVASGFIAYYITLLIFSVLHKNEGKKWADFCLGFSIPALDGFVSKVKEKSAVYLAPFKAKLPAKLAIPKKEKNVNTDDTDDDVTEPSVKAKKQSKPKAAFSMPKLSTSKSAYVGKHEKK